MATRWIKFADKVFRSNIDRLGLPFKLNFVVTKECHSKCQNCHIWRTKPKDELTLEEIQRFTQKNPNFSWVNITGGEPSDRLDLPEVIRAFIDHSPELLLLHFPTNGLKPAHIAKTVEKVLSYNPPSLVVSVSIDGPPEVNDLIRGIPGDFDLATETFNRLRKIEGVRPMVGMTLYPKNFQLIDETMAAIKGRVGKFGWRDFHVNVGHTSEHFYGNQSVTRKVSKDILEAVRKYNQARGVPLSPLDWLEHTYQKNVEKYLMTGETPQACAALLSSCYLSETGMVYPCTIWSKPIGNIRQTDYDLGPIVKSDMARHLRQMILGKKCPNCWTPCEAYQTILANVAA